MIIKTGRNVKSEVKIVTAEYCFETEILCNHKEYLVFNLMYMGKTKRNKWEIQIKGTDEFTLKKLQKAGYFMIHLWNNPYICSIEADRLIFWVEAHDHDWVKQFINEAIYSQYEIAS